MGDRWCKLSTALKPHQMRGRPDPTSGDTGTGGASHASERGSAARNADGRQYHPPTRRWRSGPGSSPLLPAPFSLRGPPFSTLSARRVGLARPGAARRAQDRGHTYPAGQVHVRLAG